MEKNFEYYAELVKQYQVEHQEKNQANQDFAEKYGFRIEETWNLNTEMICWLLPRLAYLKQVNSVIPSNVFLFIDGQLCMRKLEYNSQDFPCNKDEISKYWKIAMQEMLDGFELYVKSSYDVSALPEDDKKQMDNAFILLVKNFDALWV